MIPKRKPMLIGLALLTLTLLTIGFGCLAGPEAVTQTIGVGMVGMAVFLKSQRHKGDDRIEITAGSAITAGVPQQVALGLVGIPARDIANGALDELDITGRFNVAKVNEAWSVGDNIGWDADGDPYNGTSGSGAYTKDESAWDFPVGSCVKAAAATDEQGLLLLNEYLEGTPEAGGAAGLGNEIADPGDAGAIPITATGHVNIVTAGAETRTLAAPTQVGQQLLLSMKTDGGDAVVTVATTVNQTGNNTLTFADAGDAILLIAKQNGANVRWFAASNDGVGLSTV